MTQKGWKDLEIAGLITKPGNAFEYKTGGWRTFNPVHHPETCTNCLLCWISCPDCSVLVKDGKFDRFDYDHCKGCGICAEVCPTKPKSITMEREA